MAESRSSRYQSRLARSGRISKATKRAGKQAEPLPLPPTDPDRAWGQPRTPTEEQKGLTLESTFEVVTSQAFRLRFANELSIKHGRAGEVNIGIYGGERVAVKNPRDGEEDYLSLVKEAVIGWYLRSHADLTRLLVSPVTRLLYNNDDTVENDFYRYSVLIPAVSGVTLGDLHSVEGLQITEEDFWKLAHQIMSTVAELHELGVCQGSVHGLNILIELDRTDPEHPRPVRARLIDFGRGHLMFEPRTRCLAALEKLHNLPGKWTTDLNWYEFLSTSYERGFASEAVMPRMDCQRAIYACASLSLAVGGFRAEGPDRYGPLYKELLGVFGLEDGFHRVDADETFDRERFFVDLVEETYHHKYGRRLSPYINPTRALQLVGTATHPSVTPAKKIDARWFSYLVGGATKRDVEEADLGEEEEDTPHKKVKAISVTSPFLEAQTPEAFGATVKEMNTAVANFVELLTEEEFAEKYPFVKEYDQPLSAVHRDARENATVVIRHSEDDAGHRKLIRGAFLGFYINLASVRDRRYTAYFKKLVIVSGPTLKYHSVWEHVEGSRISGLAGSLTVAGGLRLVLNLLTVFETLHNSGVVADDLSPACIVVEGPGSDPLRLRIDGLAGARVSDLYAGAAKAFARDFLSVVKHGRDELLGYLSDDGPRRDLVKDYLASRVFDNDSLWEVFRALFRQVSDPGDIGDITTFLLSLSDGVEGGLASLGRAVQKYYQKRFGVFIWPYDRKLPQPLYDLLETPERNDRPFANVKYKTMESVTRAFEEMRASMNSRLRDTVELVPLPDFEARYPKVSFLGSGQFGEVRLRRDVNTGELLAFKTGRAAELSREIAFLWYIREYGDPRKLCIGMFRRLICAWDPKFWDITVYLAVEPVKGTQLSDETISLTENHYFRVLLGMVITAQELMRIGVEHNDQHGNNYILEEDEDGVPLYRARLIDFGEASATRGAAVLISPISQDCMALMGGGDHMRYVYQLPTSDSNDHGLSGDLKYYLLSHSKFLGATGRLYERVTDPTPGFDLSASRGLAQFFKTYAAGDGQSLVARLAHFYEERYREAFDTDDLHIHRGQVLVGSRQTSDMSYRKLDASLDVLCRMLRDGHLTIDMEEEQLVAAKDREKPNRPRPYERPPEPPQPQSLISRGVQAVMGWFRPAPIPPPSGGIKLVSPAGLKPMYAGPQVQPRAHPPQVDRQTPIQKFSTTPRPRQMTEDTRGVFVSPTTALKPLGSAPRPPHIKEAQPVRQHVVSIPRVVPPASPSPGGIKPFNPTGLKPMTGPSISKNATMRPPGVVRQASIQTFSTAPQPRKMAPDTRGLYVQRMEPTTLPKLEPAPEEEHSDDDVELLDSAPHAPVATNDQHELERSLVEDIFAKFPLDAVEKPAEVRRISADDLFGDFEIEASLEKAPTPGVVKSAGQPDIPNTLMVTLREHQVEGLKFMQSVEDTPMVRGGILADDMGLGKTLQMLALIASRRSADPRRKTTLIVAPVALIFQWCDEIRNKLAPGTMTFAVHHGAQRLQTKHEISAVDVVITTGGTILAEALKVDERYVPLDAKMNFEERLADASREGYPILGYPWFRIIVDEAHAFANSEAKSTIALCSLDSMHRWCLTGTPLSNRLSDLQSLIGFLKIQPYSDRTYFRKTAKIKDVSSPGYPEFKKKLDTFMIRRTKDVLNLPKLTENVIRLELSEPERTFYDKLEEYAVLDYNVYLAAPIKFGMYAEMLVHLLRLRQACVHPHLIGDTTRGERQRLDVVSSPTPINQAVLQHIKEHHEELAQGCRVCHDTDPNDPQVLSCAHVFCRECVTQLKEDSRGCPVCYKEIDGVMIPLSNVMEAIDPTYRERHQNLGNTRRDLAVLKQAIGKDQKTGWISSTKVDAIMSQLKQDLELPVKEKIVIFSQFVSFFDLLQKPLDAKGYKYLRYDGGMTTSNRTIVVRQFISDKSIPIMLISLKAGGVGLNLTAASRVYFADCWWNPMIEAQAVGRAYRFGQQLPVTVTRFIIDKSIEDRVLALQEKKKKLFEDVINSSVRNAREGPQQPALSIKDIGYLFNATKKFIGF